MAGRGRRLTGLRQSELVVGSRVQCHQTLVFLQQGACVAHHLLLLCLAGRKTRKQGGKKTTGTQPRLRKHVNR